MFFDVVFASEEMSWCVNRKFEHFPEFIWWWPNKCKLESVKKGEEAKESEPKPKGCKINMDAQLLIHVPFDLMKEFLEVKDDTIQKRFKQLLLDFFGHDSPKDPKTYEGVAKVYRLLADVYSRRGQENLKYDFYEIAAAFANQAPDYDEEQRDEFRELPNSLLMEDPKRPEDPKWLKLLKNPPSTKLRADDEDKAADLFVLHRRAVVHYSEFARKLDAIAMSLKSEFTGVYATHGVKSVNSIKEKRDKRGITFRDLLDYLRGTIHVG